MLININFGYVLSHHPEYYSLLRENASVGAIALLSKDFYNFISSIESESYLYICILEHFYKTDVYKTEKRFITINGSPRLTSLSILAGNALRQLVPSSLYTYEASESNIFVPEDIDEIAKMYNRGYCLKYDCSLLSDTVKDHIHLKFNKVDHILNCPLISVEWCKKSGKFIKNSCEGDCSDTERIYNFNNHFLEMRTQNLLFGPDSQSGGRPPKISTPKSVSIEIKSYYDLIMLTGLYNSGICMNLSFFDYSISSDENINCRYIERKYHKCFSTWFDLQFHKHNNKQCSAIMSCDCKKAARMIVKYDSSKFFPTKLLSWTENAFDTIFGPASERQSETFSVKENLEVLPLRGDPRLFL